MEPNENVLLDEATIEKKSIFPFILKFGIIGAALLILISVLQTLIIGPNQKEGFSVYSVLSLGLVGISYVAYILFMFLALMSYKKSNGGFVSLGKAFGITYLTGLFMAIVGVIASLLMMYTFGMDNYATNFEGVGMEPPAFKLILFATLTFFFFNCIGGAFAALIVSAIMKRDRPISFNTY